MERDTFEGMLDQLAAMLTTIARAMDDPPTSATAFEKFVRDHLPELLEPLGAKIDNPEPHPHVFPDILIREFGIEVKVTDKDSWRTVANSVFEGSRREETRYVYVLYGKMGGDPEVRWSRYDDCVIHVRTSHRPRFEVDMTADVSLFDQIGVTYEEFVAASEVEKMEYIREYARGRLKEGERLWWLPGETEEDQHTLPMEVRLYLTLQQDEKRQYRAEAALLCPQVCKPSRSKGKYDDVALYLITYHGVLVSQARDLFSAGSVAERSGLEHEKFIARSLWDIETEMRRAAAELEDALFEEYWGESCPPERRIQEWLRKADHYAGDSWTPSEVLFTDDRDSEASEEDAAASGI